MNEEQALRLVELQSKTNLSKTEKTELAELLALLNNEETETVETETPISVPKVESFTGNRTNKEVIKQLILDAGYIPATDANLSVRFLTFHENGLIKNKETNSDFVSMVTTDAVKTMAVIAKISTKHYEKWGFKAHVDFGVFKGITKICFGYEGNGKIAYYSEFLQKVVPYQQGFNIRQVVGEANPQTVESKRLQYESVEKAKDTFFSVMGCNPDMTNESHREVYLGIVGALAK